MARGQTRPLGYLPRILEIGMPNSLDLETLLTVPYVDPDMGFDISPDGSQAVFSWNHTGRWEIYILNLKGNTPPPKKNYHWYKGNFGDPVANKDLWHERSPFFFLDQIQSPVQLICGENDLRCPASESKQAYNTLANLGKESEYHLYRGEGHFFLKNEN